MTTANKANAVPTSMQLVVSLSFERVREPRAQRRRRKTGATNLDGAGDELECVNVL
jgi:hypothetical protein